MRLERPIDLVAPAERLAVFRIATTGFTLGYLLVRGPVFLALGDRSSTDFDGAGLLRLLAEPPGDALITTVWVLAALSGVATAAGWRHRLSAIAFALCVGFLTMLRSSWGQLLHFENLMALFAVVVACAPAADAWSLDARRRQDRGGAEPVPDARYGHPLLVAAWIVVATYVIAGIAKLRYGGVDWLDGDTLRNHIASAAARLDLLGGDAAPFAELAVRSGPVLTAAAFVTVALELGAPLALLDRRLRTGWVLATWGMHVGILATMAIGFPSPLFGVAFLPFFRSEQAVERGRSWWRTRRAPDFSTATVTSGSRR
ncbi:MAG: HTTM domain-containing protein [Actinomycetota bacterium]